LKEEKIITSYSVENGNGEIIDSRKKPISDIHKVQ
jgi:hypothetical protein